MTTKRERDKQIRQIFDSIFSVFGSELTYGDVTNIRQQAERRLFWHYLDSLDTFYRERAKFWDNLNSMYDLLKPDALRYLKNSDNFEWDPKIFKILSKSVSDEDCHKIFEDLAYSLENDLVVGMPEESPFDDKPRNPPWMYV